jgi:hypothetical protein
MHFHLPRPLHGWREFAGEVGIIVLGVLIALGAEQLVEALHDRYIAADTRRDVREEAAIDLEFYRARLQESPCVHARLGQLGSMLEKGSIPAGAASWIGRPDDYPIFAERWHAVTSSARTSMFPPLEQARLDNLYAVLARFEEHEKAEQVAWTDLKTVEHLRGTVDGSTRFALLRALEEARHEDYQMRLDGFFAQATARRLGIAPNLNYGPKPAQRRSICLPSSTSPEQAERLLSSAVPHPD